MCKISRELVDGLEPNLHGYNIGAFVVGEHTFSLKTILAVYHIQLNKETVFITYPAEWYIFAGPGTLSS